jgi:hypothetical protein
MGFSFSKLFRSIKNFFTKTLGTFFTKTIGGAFKALGKYILRFLIWMWKVIRWIGLWLICGFNKILRLPQCFLWYFLEFVGFVVYLPFRILFALIDLIYPGFNKIVYDFWCFLYRLDNSVYSATGFHFMHYPDEIIETCYRCKVDSFPTKI